MTPSRPFRARWSAIAIGLLLVASGPEAAGQLAQGDRVRVRAAEPAPGRFTGIVARTTTDWLTLRVDGAQVVVPVGAINRVDLSVGHSTTGYMGLGGAIGGVAGLLAGILIVADDDDCGATECFATIGLEFQLLFGLPMIGAALGAGVGLVAGTIWPREQWTRVGPGPAAGGFGLGVTVQLPAFP